MSMPYLTLHPSQIRDIAASIDTGPELAVRVKPTQRDRDLALEAIHAAGVKELPSCGAFTSAQLDEICRKAFPSGEPLSIQRRLEFKGKIYAGGLLLEPSPVNKEAIVRAGLMLKKAGVPAPDGKPYTIAEFDELMAGKDISVSHKLEIKAACLAAGIIDAGVVSKPSVVAQAVEAARSIVDAIGIPWRETGTKLSVGLVDERMERLDWNSQRRINAKTVLASANVL
jgi:hypothetical protein